MTREYGERFLGTATGTTTAVATMSAIPGRTYYITDISASSDLAGAVAVVRRGTTIIWEAIIAANTSYNHSFVMPIVGATGESVSITVGGTASCRANIAGYIL